MVSYRSEVGWEEECIVEEENEAILVEKHLLKKKNGVNFKENDFTFK